MQVKFNAVWCFPYQLLGCFWFTDFDNGSFHLPDLINMAHDGFKWSTVDIYSSQAPDPASGISWGLCLPWSRLWYILGSVLARFSDRNCELDDRSLYTFTIHFIVGN
jgi:hypothetical protein